MVKAGVGLSPRKRRVQQQTQTHQHECQRAHFAVHRIGLAWIHHDGDLGKSGDGRTAIRSCSAGCAEPVLPSCAGDFCLSDLNDDVRWHCWQRRPNPAWWTSSVA